MYAIAKRHLPLALFLFVFLAVSPAWAMDLDSAKAQGLVGEKLNGYVGIVTALPTPEVSNMVDEINRRRRGSYQEIANRTPGATLASVEVLAGEKLIQRTPSGQFVETAPGRWVKKP
ncbi:YdbL family protein [Parvibaculum sp.]|uniref:YdbL family protein n=1 Tax=Parvibaculum sp. TaxID=2024848 RepID=UPI0039194208